MGRIKFVLKYTVLCKDYNCYVTVGKNDIRNETYKPSIFLFILLTLSTLSLVDDKFCTAEHANRSDSRPLQLLCRLLFEVLLLVASFMLSKR